MDSIFEVWFRRSGREVTRVEIIQRDTGRVVFSGDSVLLSRDVLYKLVERICEMAGVL